MISFPLNLRLSTSPRQAPPAAWFIPGGDPQTWLDELQQWGIAISSLRLFVLPRGLNDRSLAGVLAVPPDDATPADVRRGQAYCRAGDRLYLPAGAELSPPVSSEELNRNLTHAVQVMHPTCGLVGFAATDALRVVDLLQAKSAGAVRWDAASAGDAVRLRLLAVLPDEPPSVTVIIEEGRDDIGSESAESLPRHPDESLLGGLAKKAALPAALAATAAAIGPLKLLAWLARGLGGKALGAGNRGGKKTPAGGGGSDTSSEPGWTERLHDWAAKNFDALTHWLRDQRQRELDRLQRLMEEDPDEGLRHALPLNALPGRGTPKMPSSRLGTRNTDFNLKKIGGYSGAGDSWDIQQQQYLALVRSYREAANREMRLGRYRRAAYIFAELLNELSSAASALEQGRHFREAAVLYREKLNNPLKAAECLEKGGLLIEAAAIFEELKRFEHAGELWLRLERTEEANRCFREEVNAALAKRDYIRASDMLEKRLASPDEALRVLTDAWPSAESAGLCLHASFALLGRLARHEETARRLSHLLVDPVPVHRRATVVAAVADLAINYPDKGVQVAATDGARVAAATALVEIGGGGDRTTVLRAMEKVDPADRLLARDVQRFLGRPIVPMAAPPPPASKRVEPVRRFSLHPNVFWLEAAATESGFIAIGHLRETLIVARGLWDGRYQTQFWNPEKRWAVTAGHMLHHVGKSVLLGPARISGSTSLLAADLYADAWSVCVPPWATENARAMDVDEFGVAWLVVELEEQPPVLRAHRVSNGDLIVTHALPELFAEPHETPFAGGWNVIARKGTVFVSRGDRVVIYGAVVKLDSAEKRPPALSVTLGAAVERMAGSPSAPCVAVALSEGAAVINEYGEVSLVGLGMPSPRVVFLGDGTLVVASENEGRRYAVTGAGVRRLADFAGIGANVISLTPTTRLNGTAVFKANGAVEVFELRD